MSEKKDAYDRLVDWFDSRFGFGKTPLRPVPDYNLNPLYWLGILMITCFMMQGATGVYRLLYYVPTPDGAYSSVTNIINNVPLGHWVETLHVYTGYAMMLLAFMHLVRNYFGSAFKNPRELMWVAGVVMMTIVIGFGVTGYLLPWTVISKSATDVAIGIANQLPWGLGTWSVSLLRGTGSDAAELTRFFVTHIVILPAALLAMIAAKIYMFEVHGPSYIPAYGKAKKSQIWPWFPKIFLYATKLLAVFIAILFAVAAAFPIVLAPEYTPQTASQYIVQPEWYLLPVYQILKFGVFEGAGLPVGIGLIILFFVFLILLPFYDRKTERRPGSRPWFSTLGLITLTEFIVLMLWGYLTPGQQISGTQVIEVMGGVALAVILVSQVIFRLRRQGSSGPTSQPTPTSPPQPKNDLRRTYEAKFGLGRYTPLTALFIFLLGIGSASLASLVQMLTNAQTNLTSILPILIGFVVSTFLMVAIVKKLVVKYETGVAPT